MNNSTEPTITESCATCAYFVPGFKYSTINAVVGRSPTTTIHLTPSICRRFPQYQKRKPTDWCGEHKPKPPTTGT